MRVPATVIELHEADAAFDQTPGEQAVVRERHLAGLGAVHVMNGCRFAREVDSLRHAGLHAIGKLVCRDTCLDFRVA
jgi:hypothetical protein